MSKPHYGFLGVGIALFILGFTTKILPFSGVGAAFIALSFRNYNAEKKIQQDNNQDQI
jgi:hypothetical protein